MASALIKAFRSFGYRVGYVVNREELIRQSWEKFKSMQNEIGIIKAGFEANFRPDKPIQLIMIQTYFARRKKLQQMNLDVILVDEIHDGYNGSRIKTIFDDYSNAKILAKTATPIDGKGNLLSGFDDYIQDLQVSDLQKLGYLVPERTFAPVKLDLGRVKVASTGDYETNELSSVCSNSSLITNIVEQWKKQAGNLLTLVFAVDIAHAETLYNSFTEAGVKTEIIHSQMDNPEDRQNILKKFENREIQVLVNVSVLTTGFDCPPVECVALARPTKSLRLWIQMIGRGLRPSPKTGKKECLILDFGNCSEEFGLPSEDRIFEPASEKTQKTKADKAKEKEENLSKICTGCFGVNRKTAIKCIYCNNILKLPIAELENKTTLKEVHGKKYSYETTLELLKKLVVEKNYKSGYAKFLLAEMLELKNHFNSDSKFYQLVQNKIVKAKNFNRKPAWICFDLKRIIEDNAKND